jgi:serine protease Do/serine protease DegQ
MRFAIAIVAAAFALNVAVSAQEAGTSVSSAPAQLRELPSLAPLVKKVTPSVVNIAIRGRIAQAQNPLLNDPFFRRFFNVPDQPAEREIQAAGSGVIVDAAKGLIVTNNHVVEHADQITVTLSDGRQLDGEPVGTDPETDIAIVRVPAENLTAITLGNSDELQVGDYVVAVGNPFGIGQTITQGIVSALRRTGLGIEGYEDFIQTDASINPGNSGGALVNLRGELVGINTAIIGPSGGNVGIGFAIPINMARDVMDQLVEFKEVRRGQLGVMIQDLTQDIAKAMGLSGSHTGAVVSRVEPGSAAEGAGLKAGDIITAIGKVLVRNSSDLRNKIGLLRVGDAVDLTVLRNGKEMSLRATLAKRATPRLQGEDVSPMLDGVVLGQAGSNVEASGVEIISVKVGSRAADAGLRKGDVIVSVNQELVTGIDDFSAKVKQSSKQILINVLRNGSALFILLE